MGVEVNWRMCELTSGLHAAEAIARNEPLADSRLAAALTEPALQLAAEIRAANLPAERFWRHLIPLSANLAGPRLLLEAALTKTIGRGARLEAMIPAFEAQLAAVDIANQTALPNLNEELALRERPLREQWEARGNGMMHRIGQVTDENLVVPQCDVLLVHPALGGAGEAHLAYNSVRIEAVLANPYAELPEVVRLAWLIAQLQLDLPRYSDTIHADRLPGIARFAMLPPALVAAEAVELMRFTPEMIAMAIAAWRLAVPEGIEAAAILSQWWQTYIEARPPWNVALAALDQMFG
ncbi:MAG: hypothetical protein JF612_06255 [Planctomycetia bacterium]|nr:hypothetical protein [Planctomycetia bacterium]